MAVDGLRYRLLALDVDGTLLDRDGVLRPSTVAALARAAEAGLRPVLCTGRRYRRARPIAEGLGIDAPLVCNSGALVKEPADHGTLWRADFDDATLDDVLAVFRRERRHMVGFTDRDPASADFVVDAFPTGLPLFDKYVALNRPHAEVDPDWPSGPTREVARFHLCAVGSREEMLRFESIVLRALPGRVRTFVQKSPSYAGTMCEVLHPEASKWSAVLHLAEKWGITADEIVAVGDDMNDVPMIAAAGLGVAMGHAPAEVLAVADIVTAGHDDDGVTRLIDDILLP